MRNNRRGFWRIVGRLLNYLRPARPFSDWQNGLHIPYFASRQKVVLQRYELPWDGLRSPIRVAVLSDFHVGSVPGDRERLKECIGIVLQSRPDVILLPGDFVNMQPVFGDRVSPEAICKLLAPLTAVPAIFAVLGNHDVQYGHEAVVSALEEIGIRVMRNEHFIISIHGMKLAIAGVEDHSTGFPDVTKALDGIPPESLTILVSHDPAVFAEVPNTTFLTVCGHTHGGQIVLPFFGPIVNASEAPLKWTYGHILEGKRNLIVSSGLGTSVAPVRFNCPPEVVEINLQPPKT